MIPAKLPPDTIQIDQGSYITIFDTRNNIPFYSAYVITPEEAAKIGAIQGAGRWVEDIQRKLYDDTFCSRCLCSEDVLFFSQSELDFHILMRLEGIDGEGEIKLTPPPRLFGFKFLLLYRLPKAFMQLFFVCGHIFSKPIR